MDLHSALKTEVLAKANADGTQLSVARLVHGKDKSTLTLHANPTTFTSYGMQTTDVLAMLGFTRGACAFTVGGQCYARVVANDFNLMEFARVFPQGSKALIDAEKLLLDCGLPMATDEGWGYFFSKPSGRRSYSRTAYGDGHKSPKTDTLKDTNDNVLRFVFTFISDGSDKGWVTHIWRLNPPTPPEHAAIFKMLGLRRFEECPMNDFSACWWFFTPFEQRGGGFFDSNAEVAYKRFDALVSKFSPAVEKILLAHKAFEPFGMPIIKVQAVTTPVTTVTETLRAKRSTSCKYEYDVAISYASEDVELPEKLASLLKQRGVKVFFDKRFEAELWGKDLYRHLWHVFWQAARYCVIFVSSRYAAKLWTNHELRVAQARALQEGDQEYILPVRLDDTEIPGLLPTIKYVDARTHSVEQLADLVLKKLNNISK